VGGWVRLRVLLRCYKYRSFLQNDPTSASWDCGWVGGCVGGGVGGWVGTFACIESFYYLGAQGSQPGVRVKVGKRMEVGQGMRVGVWVWMCVF